MKKLVINTDLRTAYRGVSEEEFIETAAKIGWDGIFTDADDDNDLKKVAKCAERNALFLQSVHATFGTCHLLWEEDEKGEEELKRQLRVVREAAETGIPIVVMHAIIGFDRNSPNATGIRRFETLANEAEKTGVKIAVENTEGECYLEAVLSALKGHPAIGFCIDTGHEMCYNRSNDLITKYGKQLIATHLNDNMKITGKEITWLDDSHMMPFDGLADWQGIARRLNAVGYQGPLTFELIAKNRPERHTHDRYAALSLEEFLAAALEKAKLFREML